MAYDTYSPDWTVKPGTIEFEFKIPADPGVFQQIIDEYIITERAKSAPKPRKGDKVEVTLTGYVGSTDDYGFTLVDKRTPFGEDAEIVGGGPFNHPNATIRVIERRPAEPKVGDEISGRLLKDTPWKRGTLVAAATDRDSKYILRSDGQWLGVNSGQTFAFGLFYDDARYVVEHAPGKAVR